MFIAGRKLLLALLQNLPPPLNSELPSKCKTSRGPPYSFKTMVYSLTRLCIRGAYFASPAGVKHQMNMNRNGQN